MVIEDGIVTRRVRRPADLLRFAVAVLVSLALLGFGSILASTIAGLDNDLAKSATYLPSWLALPIGLLSSIGLILLPIGIAVNLTIRQRGRLIADAALGFLVAALVITVLGWYLQRNASNAVWFAVAGTKVRDAIPLQPYLSGVVAIVTIARVRERGRGGTLSLTVIGASTLAVFLAGGVTIVSTAVTLLLGWAAGLLMRYVIGTPTARPRGLRVADAMARAGYPVSILRATASTDRGRRYTARTEAGQRLHVVVLDRDLEGAGVLPRWWRGLRLRDPEALGSGSMRETLDRAVLISQAANLAGARVPRLLFARTIDADSCMLAFEYVEGTSLARILDAGEKVDDHTLVQTWHALASMHDAAIAHRALSVDHLVRDHEGNVWVLHPASGTIAMNDLQERIDLADLLVALSMVSTPARAVATAVHAIGAQRIARALPALQPFALSRGNRSRLRKHKGFVAALREEVLRLNAAPETTLQSMQIERVSPRRVLTAVAGVVAAYLLLGQLGQVDLLGLFTKADYSWLAIGAVAAVLTFVGAALALEGFVAERLRLDKTFLAQLSAAFATLVSPPTLGAVAVNVRYLQKSKVPSAAAGASVAVSQVLAFFVHIALLFLFGVVAGTSDAFTFDPPKVAIVALGFVGVLVALLLPLPTVRRWLLARARPSLDVVLPRLSLLAQTPSKLATGIFGMVLLNIAFCVALWASVRAFGGGGTFAAIAIVYLAGSTIGSAAPTPGGVGAVETLMTAGLVAAGLESAVAVESVLMFRLLTFWLPTIPGYAAFQYLQRSGDM